MNDTVDAFQLSPIGVDQEIIKLEQQLIQPLQFWRELPANLLQKARSSESLFRGEPPRWTR
jgi:hypothetical protein